MRPLRTYVHTFIRVQVDDPETPTSLEITKSGHTPCQARRKAFEALEQRLRDENYAKNGWRLIGQRMVPLQGAVLRG